MTINYTQNNAFKRVGLGIHLCVVYNQRVADQKVSEEKGFVM